MLITRKIRVPYLLSTLKQTVTDLKILHFSFNEIVVRFPAEQENNLNASIAGLSVQAFTPRSKLSSYMEMDIDLVISDIPTTVQVTAEYNTYKAYHGAREVGTGLQLEPDEPASLEVFKVWYEDPSNNERIDIQPLLSGEQVQGIENTLMEGD